MKLNRLALKMLWGRFLTRSGDQAWDFAVPLVLLKILPGELRVAALYYFLVRLALVLFLPRLTTLIDRINRFQAAQVGILLQLVGVILGGLSIYGLMILNSAETNQGMSLTSLIFISLVIGGIISSLGSSFMDIAIANDLVPSSFDQGELAHFNSRLRQVDLFTEVTAPVLAGLMLLLENSHIPLFGFFLVILWNIVSFFPEYGILKSIYSERPDLMNKNFEVSAAVSTPFLKKITQGWQSFFREPVALVVLAYSFLWLSVLSPHGVLLTAYLKDGWNLPEWEIGLFRGFGALFGLIATFVFSKVISKWGLVKGSQNFILFQSVMVVFALISFLMGDRMGQIGFLGFILLSRIGLYGFSLGEMQMRQIGIRPEVRGEVNGFASALTGIATLGLYGASALLPSTKDFSWLIIGSVMFVLVGAGVYSFWVRKNLEFAK